MGAACAPILAIATTTAVSTSLRGHLALAVPLRSSYPSDGCLGASRALLERGSLLAPLLRGEKDEEEREEVDADTWGSQGSHVDLA